MEFNLKSQLKSGTINKIYQVSKTQYTESMHRWIQPMPYF